MSPRKRTASPAAVGPAAGDHTDDAAAANAAPSPAAAAKKRRASKSASPAAAAAAKPSAARSSRDENNAPPEAEAKKKPTAAKKSAAAAAKVAAKAEAGGDAAAAAAASFLGPAPVPFSKSKGVVPYDASSMRPPAYEGLNAWRVISWNVAGLRSLITKHPGALAALAQRERADALCLQETKLQAADAERLFGPSTGSSKDLGDTLQLPGWTAAAWACSGGNGTKKGYAGVAVLVKTEAAKVAWARVGLGAASKHDDEGRTVAARLEDRSGSSRPPLTVVGVYVPNSGEGLKRLDYRIKEWDPALVAFVGGLMEWGQGEGGGGGGGGGEGDNSNTKPLVVVAGDLNVAHRDVDIHSPSTNQKSAGFTPEERASFSAGLIGGSALAAGQGGGGGGKGLALVDSFRARHPDAVGYTYYSYRSRARTSGKGWRLDYCLVPEWCVGEGKEGGGSGGGGGGGSEGGANTTKQQPRLYDAYILADVSASDHVPLGVVIKT